MLLPVRDGVTVERQEGCIISSSCTLAPDNNEPLHRHLEAPCMILQGLHGPSRGRVHWAAAAVKGGKPATAIY